MRSIQTRRHFLAGLATAGAATLASARGVSSQEAPLETSTVRFSRSPGICIAPQYVAEELIRAEGLTDFRYVDQQAGLASIAMLARGDIDFALDFATALAIPIDQGAPIKVLAGVHVGCYELFAHEGINSVMDLKGKTVGAGQNLGSDPHVFVTAMATHVGLDPLKDINWVTSDVKSMDLFVQHKIDAFLGFPPEPQELRARKIGHVIVNSILDRPWSQYYCCMLAANAAYAAKYPAATKRVVRAILKANDICVSRSRAGGPAFGRWRLYQAIRPRSSGAHGNLLREVARPRPGRHDAVLLAAPPRGWHDQIEPTEDHCKRHGLALSQ